MEGVSVVCARSAHQSVVRRDLTCLMGGHSGVPVVLLFLRAQINCIKHAQTRRVASSKCFLNTIYSKQSAM